MPEVKLSAVVITYNESQNIGRCVDALAAVADEILVVDSFSTDDTREICQAKGCRVLTHAFEGHIEQKNYAMAMAAHDHVLSVDADEVLDDRLKAAIATVKQNWQADGYRVNRLTAYCGQWIRHCGWYPDKKLRLWDRRKGKWGGVNPHDRVEMANGASRQDLNGDLLHYTYHTIGEHIRQMDKFSAIAAKEAHKKGKRVVVLVHIVCYPALVFFRKYILQRGFLDGYYGFVVCINAAYYRYLKYIKLRAIYQNGPKPNP